MRFLGSRNGDPRVYSVVVPSLGSRVPFRPMLLVIHRWMGLLSCAVLLVLSVTGCLLVFQRTLNRAVNPAMSYVTPGPARLPVETLLQRAVAAYPGERVTLVLMPARDTFALEAVLGNGLSVFVDPYTGTVLGTRDSATGLMGRVLRLHTSLLSGETGGLIVGTATGLALLLAVSGLVLWWPGRVYRVGRSRAGRRTPFNLHHAIGFWSSALIFVIALTGLSMSLEVSVNPFVRRLNAFPAFDPAPLRSTPAGRTRVSVDQLLQTANETLPGAFAALINLPASPTAACFVRLKFPGDRSPSGRSRVFFDQFSGRVLGVDDARAAPLGTKILNLKRSLHTGDLLGPPTSTLYFLGSLALAAQVISGVVMWGTPRRKREPNRQQESSACD